MEKTVFLEFYRRHKNAMKFHEEEEEVKEICRLTSFIDRSGKYDKIKYKQRIWHIENGVFSFPKCKLCGKELLYHDNHGYSTLCSRECQRKYNANEETIAKVKESCKKYGGVGVQSKKILEKYKNVCLEKYGVDNPAKNEKIKEKISETHNRLHGGVGFASTKIKEAFDDVMIKKYGVDNPAKNEKIKEKISETHNRLYDGTGMHSLELSEKYKNTCLEKYGEENFSKTDEFKVKLLETSTVRYGKENYTQTAEYLRKRKSTNLEKYGTEEYCHSEQFKEHIEKNFQKIFARDGYEKLGYKYIDFSDGMYKIYCPRCKELFQITSKLYITRRKLYTEICTNCLMVGKSCRSTGELEVTDFVKEIYDGEIQENIRKIIPPYEIDIFLPDLNIAIEFNGDYWHANPKIYRSEDVTEEIWKKDELKKKLCGEKGIRLLTIWELDWKKRKEVVKRYLKIYLFTTSQFNSQKYK